MKSSRLLFAFTLLILLSDFAFAQYYGYKARPLDISPLQDLIGLQQNQRAIDNEQRAIDNQRRLAEAESAKESITICSNQIYDWYSSLDSHPEGISSGWQRAMITDKVSLLSD